MGDIDLDAAEVVHHLHQSLHIHRHVVIDGQLVLVVDDLRQSGNAAAVGEGHGVYLVVGGGVGLAVGEGPLAALGGHKAVAGDLEHPQRPALDVELAVEDHVRHAVVGGGVVGVVAAFFIVDATDEDVDHIALVLLQRLDLLHQRSSVLLRLQVLLHPVYHAGRIDHDARNDGQHRQRHGQRKPHGGSFFLLSGLGAAAAAHWEPHGHRPGGAAGFCRRFHRCLLPEPDAPGQPDGASAPDAAQTALRRNPAGPAAEPGGRQEPPSAAVPSGGSASVGC